MPRNVKFAGMLAISYYIGHVKHFSDIKYVPVNMHIGPYLSSIFWKIWPDFYIFLLNLIYILKDFGQNSSDFI
jgi:hypothetical protein